MQTTKAPMVGDEQHHRVHSSDHNPDLHVGHKDRATRRALAPAHRVGIMQAPGSARIRSGIRTGTTKHFRLWMADLQLKSALQKTSTADLADQMHVSALCRSAFAIMFVHGIRNVYDLTRANVATLLKLPDVGPKKLEAVEAYLLEHNVKPSWTVAE
jgi:hypothetical protein